MLTVFKKNKDNRNDDTTIIEKSTKRDKVGLPTESIHYKRYKLYIKQDNMACIQALKYVVQIENDVHVSDVSAIPKYKRPSWLIGVPTLIDIQNKKKFTGTDAINVLKHVVTCEPLPYSSVNKKYYKFGETGDTKNWGAPARVNDFIMPDFKEDPRYKSSKPVSIDHVMALQTLRDGSSSASTPLLQSAIEKQFICEK